MTLTAYEDLNNTTQAETCNKIQDNLSNQIDIITTLQWIADACKLDSARDALGYLIPSMLALLPSSNTDIIRQFIRASGNLTCNHPANRRHYTNSLVLFMPFFEIKEVKAILNACLFNICLDTEEHQIELISIGAVKYLLTDMTMHQIAILEELIQHDSGIQAIAENVVLFLKALEVGVERKDQNVDPFEEMLELLCESGIEIFQKACRPYTNELIELHSLHITPLFSKFIVNTMSHLVYMDLIDDENTIHKLISFMQLADQRSISAALILGNLARSDISCTKFMESYKILPILKSGCESTLTALTSDPEDFTKEATKAHAFSGFLQNLSICKQTKVQMKGCIHVLLGLANTKSIGGIRTQCISTLKNLFLFPNDVNCDYFIKLPLKEVNDLLLYIKSGESEDLLRLRSEGARLVAHLIRNFCHTNNQNGLDILEEAGCLDVIRWMTSGVNANGPTNDTLFPVIQNEGIVALTLLCSHSNQHIKKIMDWSETEKIVIGIMQSEVPEEFKLNCVSFVSVLKAKDCNYLFTGLYNGIVAVFTSKWSGFKDAVDVIQKNDGSALSAAIKGLNLL